MKVIDPFAGFALILLSASSCSSVYLPEHPPSRRFEFELHAEVASLPQGATSATLWVPAPSADQRQELEPMEIERSQGTLHEEYDEMGNRILSFTGLPRPDQPMSLGYKVVVRRFRVMRPKEDRETGAQPKDSVWLKPAALAPPEKVRKDALFMTAKEPGTLGKARILYDQVIDSLRLAGPRGNRGGQGDLEWILAQRTGDATDFHSLFIAYCQSIGIPAKFEAGYLVPLAEAQQTVALDASHSWASFRVPGMGWIPIDAAEAERRPDERDFFFGGLTEHRIRLTRGRDVMLKPRQQGPPLSVFVRPYAEADGIDITDRIRWRIQVRSLPEDG